MDMKRTNIGLAAAFAAVAFARPAALADELTWWDEAADWTWSTSVNAWNGGASAWVDGSSAVFPAGAQGTVTVDETVAASGVSFAGDGLTVAGDGEIALTGDAPALDVAADAAAVLSARLSGAAPFSKTGAGTLTLGGANAGYAPSSPVRVEEGTLKLTPGVTTSLGAASGSAPARVVVAPGATLDLNAAHRDVGTLNVEATISGSGHDGKGALVDYGMVNVYNKYLQRIVLADDALVGAYSQFYARTVESQGHELCKTGGVQMCVDTFNGPGDIRVKGGAYVAFNPKGLGDAVGKTILDGGQLYLWIAGATDAFAEPVVAEKSSSITISTDNGFNVGVWEGPLEIPAGRTLSMAASRAANKWHFKADAAGEGILAFAAATNLFLSPSFTFPGTVRVNAGSRFYYGEEGGTAGTLGTAGRLENNGVFHPMRRDAVVERDVCGGGYVDLVYTNAVTFRNCTFTNNVRPYCGAVTFHNVKGLVYDSLQIGVARSGAYPDILQTTASVTLEGDETDIAVRCVETGNGDIKTGDHTMTGIVNHVGGRLRVTGKSGDNSALHLGHWPRARGYYYMSGGELVVEDPAANLAVAVDGQGWFYQSGGAVYTPEFCVNIRSGDNGKGWFHMTGGDLHLGGRGLTTGESGKAGAPHEVYLGGGKGGTIHAWGTNTSITVTATLMGMDEAEAVTFDTGTNRIVVGRALVGEGGFNKVGMGDLLMTNACTYAGVGRVKEGAVRFAHGGCVAGTLETGVDGAVDLSGATMAGGKFAGVGVVSNGVLGAGATLVGGADGAGTLTATNVALAAGAAIGVEVSADGGAGTVAFVGAGAFPLAGVKVKAMNPERLAPGAVYPFATCVNGFADARLDQSELPDGWYVRLEKAGRGSSAQTLVLAYHKGTVIMLR